MTFPFIARRAGEEIGDFAQDLLIRNGVLRYADERPADRDQRRVLWVRQPDSVDSGPVAFGQTHARRQQQAALGLLCQVCAGDPDEDEQGLLWLLPEAPAQTLARIRGGSVPVCYPPICDICRDKALRMCPPLRESHCLLRATDVEPYGVLGILARQKGDRVALHPDREIFPYNDPRLPRVLALQQSLLLHGVAVQSRTT